MSSDFKTRALTGLLRWFGRMSPRARQRAGACVGWLARCLARSRARIVRRNLEICFPDQSPQTREQWARDHFRAQGQSIVDRGVLWYGSPEAIREMASVSGAETINALAASGRPVILLAPHFIGLDVAATRLTMEVPSGATMYTPQRDPAVDAIVRAGRKRFNEVFLVSRKEGVRDLIRHFRDARPVYYLPDMDFGRNGSVFVPFFGVPAATLVATAQLARKWNAAVLPVLDFWDPASGRYHVEVLPPLDDFPGQDSLEEATARLNRELEGWIRRCPSQYYWVHRRFKTRPEGSPKLY
ncbi:lysophospholipid acyltransferase family protein [Bordetella hinzii]|uniref:lysophospholipid acyltransferase family protein n=1 Tax=Bordetella hinzii TaxID=103855 RepID=UPI001C014CCC|nr:lysophospholipid acyltransferase family protein [Bordetella hinzii]QWF40801.1 lysophospholipid acyltransferase family protein [Bordetella hinzii]QWF49885.1 lysophospholipid acyltransferase family protein [Bordetella hinzii]QWF54420.1 lysophospholipid acyltransferase family protein [Bordetella hinzii]